MAEKRTNKEDDNLDERENESSKYQKDRTVDRPKRKKWRYCPRRQSHTPEGGNQRFQQRDLRKSETKKTEKWSKRR